MSDYMKEAFESWFKRQIWGNEDFKTCLREAWQAALLAHIQRRAVPEDLRMRLVEAWDYGQFADDFDQPLAKRIRADIRALCELLASRVEVQVNPTASAAGWHLDESDASLLHQLTSPDDDGEHSPITLRAGNVCMDDGTVKFGLLCEYTDYPDEGATLLVEGQPTVAAPAPAATGHAEADRIVARLMSSDPDFQDCADAAALIQREIRGPDGFATWRDAAIAERLKRIASAPTAPAEVPMPEPVAYLYTLEYGGTVVDTRLSVHQLNYPFGVCGSDYLERSDDGVSYVRQTPLYTAAALSVEVK